MREAELLTLLASAPEATWRFDVDVSLDAAVQMARVAQIAGIHGTFYIDSEAETYNASSRSSTAALNEIVKRGHSLGAHVDYRPELGDRSAYAAALRAWDAMPHAVRVLVADRVSFHMPDESVLWVNFGWCESAYAARWKGRYLSDSRGRGLERDPTNADQVVLHPEWWFGISTEGVC